MTKLSGLNTLVGMAQNSAMQGGKLITDTELQQLRQMIIKGELPVWDTEGGTSLADLRKTVERMPLLPQERQETLSAIDTLEQLGNAHASSTFLGAQFKALWHRALGGVEKAVQTTLDVGRAFKSRIAGPAKLNDEALDAARTQGDPVVQAETLQRLISPFSDQGVRPKDRLAQMERLLKGLDAQQISKIKQAYVQRFDTDPFIHIVGGGLGQSILASRTQGSLNLSNLARQFVKRPLAGFENVETWAVKTYQDIIRDPQTGPSDTIKKMATLWLGPKLSEKAQLLAQLKDKVDAGVALTEEERKTYFAEMPFIGIRTRSKRSGNDPTLEELTLQNVWTQMGRAEDLAQTMAKVEAAFPKITLPQPDPGQKSVAVVVSQQGAQWQELMGYVMEMQRNDVHVQLFTPDGRPAGFQLDSLSRSNTSGLGYGAPEALDPAGPTGMVARELLSTAVAAKEFDPKAFDQIYVAGGLGLNEDGVRVEPADAMDRKRGAQSGPESVYSAHPDIAGMINAAAALKMPVLAVCHGPSVFIADNIELDVKGSKMAALGPFEAYVAWTGRTGRPFPHMALVHNDARRAGVQVDPVRDALKPDGVVKDTAKTKAGELTIVTGPHPRAARTLGLAGLELLGISTDPPRYLS